MTRLLWTCLLFAASSAVHIATPHPPPAPNLDDLPLIAPTPTPPPPLRCLEKYYEVGTITSGGSWFALLADGTHYAYDDGLTKTFEEKLAHPCIKNAFERRYPTGAPIVPVTDPEDDEGRIRLDPIFMNTYGKTAWQVQVTHIQFLGQKIAVNVKAKDAFLRVEEKLTALEKQDPKVKPFLQNIGGTFNWRNVAGTDRPSAHSYGVSIDLNAKLGDFWRWKKGKPEWKNRIPRSIVDVFESEGFIWGGRWYHFDTMHFEYRPELTDAECYPDEVILPLDAGGVPQ